MRAHHTPGHSPGGVCAAVPDPDAPWPTLSGGDTLCGGSNDGTGLSGGHLQTLIASTREVPFPLGHHAVVYPRHGESTTTGAERRTNPFLT